MAKNMKKSYIAPTVTEVGLIPESLLIVGSQTMAPIVWDEEDDQEEAE